MAAADRLGAVLERMDDRQTPEPARLGVFTDVEEARRQLADGRAARARKGRRPLPPLAHPVTPARRLGRPGPPPAG
jgi:hypothetical protein